VIDESLDSQNPNLPVRDLMTLPESSDSADSASDSADSTVESGDEQLIDYTIDWLNIPF